MVLIGVVSELGRSLSESTLGSKGKSRSLVFLSGQCVEGLGALDASKSIAGLCFKVVECLSNHFY